VVIGGYVQNAREEPMVWNALTRLRQSTVHESREYVRLSLVETVQRPNGTTQAQTSLLDI